MNLDKRKQYKNQIIQELLNVSRTSIGEISIKIKLSEKTTGIYINEINDYLINNDLGRIVKKRGIGIWLNATEKQRKEISKFFKQEAYHVSINKVDAVALIKHLLSLKENEYITKQKLSELTFQSVPTLNKSLEKLHPWFYKYNLTIEARPSKGISLVGNEFSRRQAMMNLAIYQDTKNFKRILKFFAPNVDVDQIEIAIKTAEDDWNIQFTEDSFKIICVMVCISLSRVKTPVKNMDETLRKTEFYNEYNFSEHIFQIIKGLGYTHYNTSDIKLIALQIIIANKIKWNHSPKILDQISHQSEFDEDLKIFVKKLIESISSIMRVDFTKDIQLENGLVQHLRSAIFRMKYGQEANKIGNLQIKKMYKNIYLSVLATSPLFEEHYGVQITENELNYIVLYIETALLRKQQKVDAIMITDLGRAQRLLAVESIKHYISQIEDIQIVSKATYLKKKIASNKIIFSTETINDDNVLVINSLPTSKDLDRIKNKINEFNLPEQMNVIFSKESQTLFDVNLISLNIKVENKKELLAHAIQKMEDLGKVNSKFFNSVWTREITTTTSIGNMVAVPHGNMTLVNEPSVYLMTLDEPIRWFDDEMVQMVFILATKMNNEFELNRMKSFFRDLINFTENQSLQDELLRITNKTKAYNFLFG